MPDVARDAEAARLIATLACQFRVGCSNAGPHGLDPTLRDPAECPECVAAFLVAVRRVLAERDARTAPSG